MAMISLMNSPLLNYPAAIAVVSFLVMFGAARLGARVSELRRLASKELEQFNIVLGATLTLLALIVGFAFSMAVGRYDQRKNYEEEEANAIGTEYVRGQLLPGPDADRIQALLKRYLQDRIQFYEVRDRAHLDEINHETGQLQNQMWSIVVAAAKAQPSPITALTVAGMNDVLNRQGYTQAAWWNRIPKAAWWLMGIIAVCANMLIGMPAGEVKTRIPLLIMPVVLAVAFMLLADLDSPRGGMIRVAPQNLHSLWSSIR
jgi:hypothetical protein